MLNLLRKGNKCIIRFCPKKKARCNVENAQSKHLNRSIVVRNRRTKDK